MSHGAQARSTLCPRGTQQSRGAVSRRMQIDIAQGTRSPYSFPQPARSPTTRSVVSQYFILTLLIYCIDNLPALLTSSTLIVPHPPASHRLRMRVRDKHNHPRNVPIRPTNPPASHQACASGEGKHIPLATKRVIVASTADHIHDVEVQ